MARWASLCGLLSTALLVSVVGPISQASADETQGAAGMVVLNPGGGRLANGSDGLQLILNGVSGFEGVSGASDNVPEDGSDQVNFANTSQWCCGGTSPMLNIGGPVNGGGHFVGEAGAAESENATSWTQVELVSVRGTTDVLGVGYSPATYSAATMPTGSAQAVLRYTYTTGGRNYVVERQVDYRYPNWFYDETFRVTIPAGNTQAVTFYIGGDAAPGNSDTGRGFMATNSATNNRTGYEVNPNSGIYIAYGEVDRAASAFDGLWVSRYNTPYTTIRDGGNIGFVLNPNSHDAGLNVQWTLGSTPGTFTRQMRTYVGFQTAEVSGSFAQTLVAPGGTGVMVFELLNTRFSAVTSSGFTVPVPAGLTLGSSSSTCGGSLTAVGSTVSLSNVTVAAASSCVVSVNVTGANGTYRLRSADITPTNLTTGFGVSSLTFGTQLPDDFAPATVPSATPPAPPLPPALPALINLPVATTPPSTVAPSTTVPAPTTVAPSTTIPTPVPVDGGALPALPPGASQVFVDGVPEVVEVLVEDSTELVLRGDGFEMSLAGECSFGCAIRTDAEGRQVLELEENGLARVEGDGFKAGTPVYVWLFSEPKFLGELTVNPDGSFAGSVSIAGIQNGNHTLQVNGTSADGKPRTANLGVLVSPEGVPSPLPTVLPATGSGTDLAVFAWVLLLTSLGGALVWFTRRREVLTND